MPRPDTLTYALNRKTDKLLKVHNDRRKAMAAMIPVGTVAGLLWVYFIGNIDRYISQWSSLFSGYSNSANLLSYVERVILIALLITTLFFGLIFTVWNRHNEKYDKLKKEVLQMLELTPCYHKDSCDCKDKYCQWLEGKAGVDLF